MGVATVGHMQSSVLSASEQEQVLRQSRALKSRLHGLLQASVQSPCVVGRRGKLYSQRLYNLTAHNPRVFKKLGEKQEVSTAVHLLLDCSGSMDGTRMKLASQACYGLALALEQCRGVNVGVTAFPALQPRTKPEHRDTSTLFPLVKHGQRVHPRFDIRAAGMTPLAESLWWVMQQMIYLKEQRKIVLILTDGVPDSYVGAKHALLQAQKVGFEVLGLGIEDNSIESLLPKSSRVIQDLGMLQNILFYTNNK